MTDTDDILEVTVPDDSAAASGPAANAGGDPVEELKRQVADLEKSRLDAAERARRAEYDAQQARSEADVVRGDAVANAIAAEQAALDAAKKELAQALSEGDYDKAAEAQDKLSTARGKLIRLEEYKTEPTPRRQTDSREPSGDPVEAYISQFSPDSQRWLRDHKTYVTDAKQNARLLAAHHDAVAEDLTPDTPAYFDHIERRLGLRDGHEVDGQRATRRGAPAIAAPPSRDPPTSNGKTTRVTLTRAEVEMAEAMGMTAAEYAKHKSDLQKSGDLRRA